MASTALAGVALLAWGLWPGAQAYETKLGERRIVVLADGTRMTLNTSTDVRVDLTRAQRTVKVLLGEALFEVAKDPGRPFVVQVADATVVATGTTFLVRSTSVLGSAGSAFDVTLIEGQVIVRRSAMQGPLVTPVVMSPGERLEVAIPDAAQKSPSARTSRPRIETLMAWQQGEALFDGTPLAEAVAEMNRYSTEPIILGSQAVAALRLSGVYRTGDNESFAHAVADLHGLIVRSGGGRIELVAGPAPSN